MHMLTIEDYSGCVNETFHAAINDGEIAIVLVEARLLDRVPQCAIRPPFSLLYRNTAALLFPQRALEELKQILLGERTKLKDL